MELIFGTLLAAWTVGGIVGFFTNILIAVVGLGFVIFFHELGHFAVAKWCDVNVERFSIGFGPILWSFRKGETEYALSVIPFGGYVKMLGQDDVDPSQLTSDEIALDPRAYSGKSVPQRMAIISAGVIMNVITGLLFVVTAFVIGVTTSPSVVGSVSVGMPAWSSGIQRGDRITSINSRDIRTFGDITRSVALSQGQLNIEGERTDGKPFAIELNPDITGTRRLIGVGPAPSLTLYEFKDSKLPSWEAGSAAAKADPPFQPRDTIRKVGDTPVETFADFQKVLAERRSETLTVYVQRGGAPSDRLVPIKLAPTPMRRLGLWMDIGNISAIRDHSPAAKAGLRVGDKISKINDQQIGHGIDPMRLPDVLASLAGTDVTLTFSRQEKGTEPKEQSVTVVPEEQPGWVETPIFENSPLSIPSLGVAIHVIPYILNVERDSAAAEAGIKAGERIKSLTFVPLAANGAKEEGAVATNEKPIIFDDEQKNWSHAFLMMQERTDAKVVLVVSNEIGETRNVTVVPRESTDWFLPNARGLLLAPLTLEQKATSIGEAFQLGFVHTRNSLQDIYLTLRNLFTRDLSIKELRGPLGIAQVAYAVVDQGGSADFLLFLGFLSVNLAVLNFLPIPVLDGGHMIFLIWEGITRRRPSEKVLVAATYCGMAFVLGLMMLVLYLDIFVHRLAVK
ncbi:MAG: RIP metalloprotease RseP [Planctomycetota bacterium]|nr:RIP metalloprotease RseP [Planctomycetota bacterium]MDA1212086.1 RIP metalloprotease RseP [Planctomycetota bacterium]